MKLYRVKIIRSLYVLAENPNAACRIAEASDFNQEESETQVAVVKSMPTDWVQDSLVYHAGEENIMLGDCAKYINESR